MIKKIQKYLLLHYPLLWNTKIVPMLFVILGLHIFAYAIAMLCGKTAFDTGYRYESVGLISFCTVLVSILILIVWLILYNHHSALKSYYPRSTNQIFKEWMLVFIICIGVGTSPATMVYGLEQKWKAGIGEEVAKERILFLDKMSIFTLERVADYSFDRRSHEPIPIPNDFVIDIDSIYTGQYTFSHNRTEHSIKIKGNERFPDSYVTPEGYVDNSLLFFYSRKHSFMEHSVYRNSNIDTLKLNEYDRKQFIKQKIHLENIESVKQLLRDKNKDSLLILMTDLVNLLASHKIKMQFTAQEWVDNIYNPPFYPLTSDMLQSKHYYDFTVRGTTIPRLSNDYDELLNSYNTIYDSYDEDHYSHRELENILLVCLHIALLVSMMIFTYRATKVRSWLTAVILSVAICFAFGFITAASSFRVTGFATMWVITFVALFVYLFIHMKVYKSQGKGKIILNLAVWSIFPLFMLIVAALDDLKLYKTDEYISSLSYYIDEYLTELFVANLLVIAFIMYPISALIRKFKGLADQ